MAKTQQSVEAIEMAEMLNNPEAGETRANLIAFCDKLFPNKSHKKLSTARLINKLIEAGFGLDSMLTDLIDIGDLKETPKGLIECLNVYCAWAEVWSAKEVLAIRTKTTESKPKPRAEGLGLGMGKGRVQGVNQTTTIRQSIALLWNRETIIANLAKVYGRNKTWAKQRMTTYERAYGPLGNADPHMPEVCPVENRREEKEDRREKGAMVPTTE